MLPRSWYLFPSVAEAAVPARGGWKFVNFRPLDSWYGLYDHLRDAHTTSNLEFSRAVVHQQNLDLSPVVGIDRAG